MGIEPLTWATLATFFILIFVALTPGVVRGRTKLSLLLKFWLGSLGLLVLVCALTWGTASGPCSYTALLTLQASGHDCSFRSFIGWPNVEFFAASFMAFTALIILSSVARLARSHGR
jgi:hypothetical protein